MCKLWAALIGNVWICLLCTVEPNGAQHDEGLLKAYCTFSCSSLAPAPSKNIKEAMWNLILVWTCSEIDTLLNKLWNALVDPCYVYFPNSFFLKLQFKSTVQRNKTNLLCKKSLLKAQLHQRKIFYYLGNLIFCLCPHLIFQLTYLSLLPPRVWIAASDIASIRSKTQLHWFLMLHKPFILQSPFFFVAGKSCESAAVRSLTLKQHACMVWGCGWRVFILRCLRGSDKHVCSGSAAKQNSHCVDLIRRGAKAFWTFFLLLISLDNELFLGSCKNLI